MANDDLVYLLRRAREERQRAAETQNNSARLAHDLMAAAYERRLREGHVEQLHIGEE